MFDINNYEIYEIVNILGLLVGIIFGAVSQKNQFCFSGSVKDYILMGSTKRASSVALAMVVAVLFTTIISSLNDIDLTQSSYFRPDINYFSIVIGSLLFGVGMMLADGCSSRHLVKFAQGDSKSLVVIIFIAIFAYATTRGLFHGAIFSIITDETLIKISSIIENVQMNLYAILSLLVIIFIFLVKKVKRIASLIDGAIIGSAIAIAWYITATFREESIERTINLTGVTFVYPSAKTLEFFTNYEIVELSFSISLIIGTLIGAFFMSQINKKYNFGCTTKIKTNNLKYSIFGGSLMGVGGVMALGCTVGQGLTGLSTLSFASFIAIISIFTAAYVTGIFLNKREMLPMCFIFDWEDEKNKKD